MGVGDFFKAVGKVSFPFITLAAQAGGPFTAMAAAQLGKVLGQNVEATPAGIEKVMSAALLDPATQIKLAESEQAFRLQIEQITSGRIKNEQDFETHMADVAAQDRASARDREKTVRDKTPQIGFYALLFGFFLALGLLFKFPIPADNKAVIFTMVGSLGTLTIMSATYYYGTTQGSSRKTELLAQAPAVEATPQS